MFSSIAKTLFGSILKSTIEDLIERNISIIQKDLDDIIATFDGWTNVRSKHLFGQFLYHLMHLIQLYKLLEIVLKIRIRIKFCLSFKKKADTIYLKTCYVY